MTISHIKKFLIILSTVTWTKFESNFTDISSYHSKWFEPRSISSSYCVIVRVRVILYTDLFRQADYLTQFETMQAKGNYLAQRPGKIENFSQGGSRYGLAVPHRDPSHRKLFKKCDFWHSQAKSASYNLMSHFLKIVYRAGLTTPQNPLNSASELPRKPSVQCFFCFLNTHDIIVASKLIKQIKLFWTWNSKPLMFFKCRGAIQTEKSENWEIAKKKSYKVEHRQFNQGLKYPKML